MTRRRPHLRRGFGGQAGYGGPVRRYEDWPARLGDALAAASRRRFEYGKHDCCLAVCGVVLAITGTDLAADFRGYKGAAAAAKVLRKHGGFAGIAEAIAKRHRIPEVHPGLAQRGDVVIVEAAGRPALGIVDPTGREVVVAHRRRGWAMRPRGYITRAWRIG